MILINIPESAHPFGFRGALHFITFCINLNPVLVEELTKGTVGEVKNIATTHAKQLF